MNKAALMAGAFLTLLSAPSALGAVIFGGGTDGNPVTLTITEDIVIPITQSSANHFLFGFIFKDVYDSPQAFTGTIPPTSHSDSGVIHATLDPGNGASIASTSYNTWGGYSLPVGDLTPLDFFGILAFSFTPVAEGGSFVIHAGTIVLAPSVLLPDNPVSEILVMNSSSVALGSTTIPEPSTLVLSFALGGAAFLRRRRAA